MGQFPSIFHSYVSIRVHPSSATFTGTVPKPIRPKKHLVDRFTAGHAAQLSCAGRWHPMGVIADRDHSYMYLYICIYIYIPFMNVFFLIKESYETVPPWTGYNCIMIWKQDYTYICIYLCKYIDIYIYIYIYICNHDMAIQNMKKTYALTTQHIWNKMQQHISN